MDYMVFKTCKFKLHYRKKKNKKKKKKWKCINVVHRIFILRWSCTCPSNVTRNIYQAASPADLPLLISILESNLVNSTTTRPYNLILVSSYNILRDGYKIGYQLTSTIGGNSTIAPRCHLRSDSVPRIEHAVPAVPAMTISATTIILDRIHLY